MDVDSTFSSRMHNYQTGRSQFVNMGDCVSETVVSNDGAPQGTVLALFLFTLSAANFIYKSDTCRIQKYCDDTEIVACVRHGPEVEYRYLTSAFCD